MLKHLTKLDGRVQAHLQGLLVAGQAGVDAASELLAECDSGAVFVNAYLAFERDDAELTDTVFQIGASAPAFEHALFEALAWLELPSLRRVTASLLRSRNPVHRCAALSGLAKHCIDARPALEQALESDDLALRRCALRCVGELKNQDLLVAVRAFAREADHRCRFWAGRSLVLLGDRTGAHVVLDAAREEPSLWPQAVELAMRAGDPSWARGLLARWSAAEETRRTAIAAMGALGDPAHASWLVAQMSDDRFARVAGEAFSMITGADLSYLDLKRDPPEELPEEGDPADADLPWPDPLLTAQWWASERARYLPGQTYLVGRLSTSDAAIDVLHHGYQRQRHSAALTLAHAKATSMLFPVTERADWQRRRLAS